MVAGSRRPATLAEIDLAAIQDAMAQTLDSAAADDPSVLRARIAQLGFGGRHHRRRLRPCGPACRCQDLRLGGGVHLARVRSMGSSVALAVDTLRVLQPSRLLLGEVVRLGGCGR